MNRVFALLALALLAGCGPRLVPLPPAVTYPSAVEARAAVQASGLVDVPVTGTGSMAPWIPAHPQGREVIVAYAGLDDTPYAELKPGNVVVYSRFGESVIHRLGEQDSRGFLAFGIANRDRDSGFVTPANYVGKVVMVALYPL